MTKLAVFANPNLVEGYVKVLNQAELDVGKLYLLKNLIERVLSEGKRYEELRMEMLKKHAKKTKEGALESDATGQAVFKSEDARKKFAKEFVDLKNIEVDIKVPELTIEDLGGVRLKGSELTALEGLFPTLAPKKASAEPTPESTPAAAAN